MAKASKRASVKILVVANADLPELKNAAKTCKNCDLRQCGLIDNFLAHIRWILLHNMILTVSSVHVTESILSSEQLIGKMF